jgi:hypothetical protein
MTETSAFDINCITIQVTRRHINSVAVTFQGSLFDNPSPSGGRITPHASAVGKTLRANLRLREVNCKDAVESWSVALQNAIGEQQREMG